MSTETKTLRRPYWYGELCAETVNEIADRMREVLDGHYFTTVICNSYDENSDRFTSVEVRTSGRLTTPIKVSADGDGYYGIHWGTTGWSMGVHTKAKTRQEGRDGRPHNYAHFTFEPDKVSIDHYAPAGYRLLWNFTVERHDAEDGAA